VPQVIRAVLWDFGGVILTSPFDAFAAYEQEIGLPDGFIRRVNATNPDANAWARLERSEVSLDEFARLFEQEAAALGGTLSGSRVLELLNGQIRPEMVAALVRVRNAGYRTACLTNNVLAPAGAPAERERHVHEVMGLFDAVIESSKVGIRKPEVQFYEIACATLGVTPHECVFLDDLGINLKPAKAMGMTTIKVVTPDQALADLEAVLGVPMRDGPATR
jgi:putative hydrolase of the HAD superfamily